MRQMDRRGFVTAGLGAPAAARLPAQPPPLKITEVRSLRLRFPGRTPSWSASTGFREEGAWQR